jgi:adenylate cyclase
VKTFFSKTLDLSPVLQQLVSSALADETYESVFEELCSGLCHAGLPLLRTHLTMQTLHPLVASVSLTWIRHRGLEVRSYEHFATENNTWLQSPMNWMLSKGQIEWHQNLARCEDGSDFPVFEEIRELGGTDYFIHATTFGDPDTALERQDGIVMSWSTDAAAGFTNEHIEALKTIQPYVGLVAKLSKQQYTSNNIVSAYLGEEVGRRVLEGQIRLGDVESLSSVIWLSDLRGSTGMAESMPATAFQNALNSYFDCTAGAVLKHRGQIIHFIGDAVLAVFPIGSDLTPSAAALHALEAAAEARERLNALNKVRLKESDTALDFGIGLHFGSVLHGNIGVPTRIEFTVIGRIVNEVSRLESLTKDAGEPLLVSRAFRELIDMRWRDLGTYSAKGVSEGMEVFAPA